jgi:hypothetical protein
MQFIKKLLSAIFLILLGFGAGFLANTFSKFEIVEKGSKTTVSTSSSATTSSQNSSSLAYSYPQSIQTTSSLATSAQPLTTASVDPNLKDGFYTTFKALNISNLKQTQQPGNKIKISDGFFKVVGRVNNSTQVNSGVEFLNIIIDDTILKAVNPSYNAKVGDLIKLSADFAPLIANPPQGYQFVDYFMQSAYKVEVISPQ